MRFRIITLSLSAVCIALSVYMLVSSLSGALPVGCGAGSGCDAVMGSRWGYILGTVPVSLPALACYLILVICILFTKRDGAGESGQEADDCTGGTDTPGIEGGAVLSGQEDADCTGGTDTPGIEGGAACGGDPTDYIAWLTMYFICGCMIGCALWFSGLQIFVLHAFCKWCTLLHLLGCVCAVMILCRGFKASAAGKVYGRRSMASAAGRVSDNRSSGPVLPVIAGIAGAALFAWVQVNTAPDIVYDRGTAGSSLPSFSSEEVYSIGPADAQKEVTLLFDFQCSHCRSLHKLLHEACAKAGVRVLLCPVPLSSGCNPYIPHEGEDRFRGSCSLTRTAIAVWQNTPSLYPAFEEWLMDGDVCPTPEEARKKAAALMEAGSAGDHKSGTGMTDSYRTRLRANNSTDTGAESGISRMTDSYLRKVYELFGRTSSEGKSGIPRFICGDRWVVPGTGSPEALADILKNL